jgi:hypothetical protein
MCHNGRSSPALKYVVVFKRFLWLGDTQEPAWPGGEDAYDFYTLADYRQAGRFSNTPILLHYNSLEGVYFIYSSESEEIMRLPLIHHRQLEVHF